MGYDSVSAIKVLIVVLLLISGLSCSSNSELTENNEEEMHIEFQDKMDVLLKRELRIQLQKEQPEALEVLIVTDRDTASDDSAFTVFREHLNQKGVHIRNVAGNILSVTAAPDVILSIAADERIISMELSTTRYN